MVLCQALYVFSFTDTLNSAQQTEEEGVPTSVLQMKKLKSREISYIAQGHTVGKWASQDADPHLLASESTVLIMLWVLLEPTYRSCTHKGVCF